jgi:hypothetical protein
MLLSLTRRIAMKTTVLGMVCLAAAMIFVVHIEAQEKASLSTFNVKEFGAKGDGKTDDTEAIRAAVKAAYEKRMVPLHPQYGYFMSFAEVYFPSGHYIVNDTIDINAVKLRGESYAAIEQKDPEKDIFFTPWMWRIAIEGLTFL